MLLSGIRVNWKTLRHPFSVITALVRLGFALGTDFLSRAGSLSVQRLDLWFMMKTWKLESQCWLNEVWGEDGDADKSSRLWITRKQLCDFRKALGWKEKSLDIDGEDSLSKLLCKWIHCLVLLSVGNSKSVLFKCKAQPVQNTKAHSTSPSKFLQIKINNFNM